MLHAILAFVLLCAAAFAQKEVPILIQNLATARQSAWVFVGLPAGHVPQSKAGWLKSESEKLRACSATSLRNCIIPASCPSEIRT